MLCTVGPCMYVILEPIFKHLGGALKYLAELALEYIIIPIINFMHTWGLFELFGYLLAFECIYEGSKLSIKEQAGFMIAIGGVLALPLLFGYSTALHTKKFRPTKNGKDVTANLFCVWMILTCIPAAIKFESTFIGYVVFAQVFYMLGFRMAFFGLGVGLGWDDDAAMERSSASSFAIILLYIILRVSEVNEDYLKPFSSPICCLGGNILYLSMLIMSSQYYDRPYRRRGNFDSTNSRCLSGIYLKYNLCMVILLIAGIAFGFTYSL